MKSRCVRSVVLFFLLIAGATTACGGSELSVQLDPEAWLLRSDLPPAASIGQALHDGAPWGRYGWSPDFSPFTGWGYSDLDRNAVDGVPPPLLTGVSVRLVLDPATSTLSGEADVQLVADGEPLDSVEFLLSAADVDWVQAENPTASYSYQNGRLTVTPQTPIPVGESWSLAVGWHDSDVEIEVEFFPEGFKKDVLVGYLGEPSTFFTFGYWYWPRLVGQETVADLDFSITYPAEKTLVMSGELVDSMDNGDGTKTDSWTFSNPARWHLSLALAEYEMATGSCGDSILEVYGIPGESIDHYPIVPSTYVPILESICEDYRTRFGDPSFGTIRLVGVDERFTNGYSSPSMIVVPNYTLDDDGSGSFPERDFYIAHEVSHQWWGNDVFAEGMDIWLTEGLADYSAISCLEKVWDDESALQAWLADAEYLLSHLGQGGRDHPLVPEDATNMEPAIYYLKGAWVFRMLEGVVGRDDLTQALLAYREAHPFLASTTQDFIDASENATGEDLTWFFDQWLHGTGVMSMSESHRVEGERVELTVTQNNAWATGPDRYFKMPMTVTLEAGSERTTEIVTVEGETSDFSLSKP